MDTEKAKSQYSLNSNHKSANSIHLARIKSLCDSDTNSDNSIKKKVPRTKLNFDDSSDENDAKSKYFETKNIYNKENVDFNNVNTRCRRKTTKSAKKSVEIDSDDEFTFNKKLQINSKIKSKRNNNKKLSSSSSENDGNNSSNDRVTSKPSNSNNLKIIPKKNIESKTKKPPSTDIISKNSDDEWEDEVRGIERRLTIADDGTYSFLASLSGNLLIVINVSIVF